MNRRPSLAIALVIAAGALLSMLGLAQTTRAANTAYHAFSSPKLGYRLELPAHWVAEPKGQVVLFSGKKGTPEYRTTISIQVVRLQAYPSLEALAADYLGQWSRKPGYRLLAQREGKLDGQPGLLLVARYQLQGEMFQQEQVVVKRIPYYYLIGYTAPQKLFKRGQPHMSRALASFKFLPLGGQGAAPPRGKEQHGK
jgi:hypothetical protein